MGFTDEQDDVVGRGGIYVCPWVTEMEEEQFLEQYIYNGTTYKDMENWEVENLCGKIQAFNFGHIKIKILLDTYVMVSCRQVDAGLEFQGAQDCRHSF